MELKRFLSAVCATALAVVWLTSVANAQDWQAGAGDNWKQMLAAAKKEGKVVLVGPPTIGQPMTEGFRRDTGIDVEFLGIIGAPLFQRMTREYKAGTVTMDVVFSGAVTMPLQEFMEPLRDKLILPGVTEPKNWIDGKLKFADNAGTYIPYFGEQVSGYPLANTSTIKPGKPIPYESDQTTHYSVADEHGNLVATTYTLNLLFGSGIVATGTGITLNNEMDDFSMKPGVPNGYGLVGQEANAIAPGKRMERVDRAS